MKHIAQNFKGHYKEIVLGPLFKLFEAILELIVPLVVANMIDVGVKNHDTALIWQRAILMVVLAAFGIVFAVICQYFAAVAGGQFGRSLRRQLYGHVLRLTPAQTQRFGTGSLIMRLTNDTNQIQTGLNLGIRLGTRAPFLAIGSIVMALVLNFKIGLIFLISTPVIVFVLYLVMKRTVPGYGKIQQEQDNLSGLSGENLEGMRVIRAFSRQKNEKQEFDGAAAALSSNMIRVGKVSALLNPLTSLAVAVAIVAIVWVGAGFTFAGDAKPGEIIALVTYMNQTLLALIVAVNLVVVFTRAVASTKRVAAVLDTQPTITDGPGADAVAGAAAVEFENVYFSYHAGEGEDALSGIGFSVQPGQTIGIIGGTGSGKSTLVNLLVRNYDAGEGSVYVDGNNVKEYTLPQLRERVGLVPQTAALFSGSIRRNLAVGRQNATDKEMWAALGVAQAEEFVKKMPEQLDAYIEEGGKNLSGGQKQRITIARALVKKPAILILDDSASALDLATDAALRAALKRETHALTTIMVSQRAGTIKSADMILVLDDGRVVAKGNHQELLQSSEVYREICISQGLA